MKRIIFVISLILLLFLLACTQPEEVVKTKEEVSLPSQPGLAPEDQETEAEVTNEKGEVIEQEEPSKKIAPPSEIPSWFLTDLKDINLGDTYTLDQFKGTPIVMETFAVWCPTCTRQQKEIKELHELIGDEAISISLDTDPNEDESIVRSHANANGFDWIYSVPPKSFTESLIEEFGVGIVNAPGAPVVLICGDQSMHFLKRGIKPAEELQQEIQERC